MQNDLRITYVARSFLDYRIPVYKALDELSNQNFTLIFNADIIPDRCTKKIITILGDRAIPLRGEKRLLFGKNSYSSMANEGFSFPYHKDLIKTIRATKPNVIISDGYLKWTYGSLWVRIFNTHGIKHVMCYERTKHTERNAGWLRKLTRKVEGWWIDAIDCNGQLTEEYVRSLGYKKKLTFGHMVADTEGLKTKVAKISEDEAERLREKLGCKQTVFLYVGRLIALKGIVELLKGWKAADLHDATLLLVGDGNQRKEIESLIKTENIKNVILAGKVDYDNIAPYYAMADCFVIATLEDNWSLVVPEAMSCGLPVICSIYNGCWPELVKPENGWTFDPIEVESVAGVFKESFTRRDEFATMGEASQRIVANHTPMHAAQGIMEACVYVTRKKLAMKYLQN